MPWPGAEVEVAGAVEGSSTMCSNGEAGAELGDPAGGDEEQPREAEPGDEGRSIFPLATYDDYSSDSSSS